MSADKLSDIDFIKIARQLISFETTPHASTHEMVLFIKNICDEWGLFCEVQQETQNGTLQSNVIIRHDNDDLTKSHFLLQSHLDTPDPGSYGLWKKNNQNPFDAVIDENYIYGLGVSEVKLDFLCKLISMYKVKNSISKNGPLKPLLVGTYGQETGMHGALKLIRKNKLNARYALISEPSNLQIIHAAKGFVTVEIRIPMTASEIKLKKQISENLDTITKNKIFSGIMTHSSTPHLGENAGVKLLDFIDELADDNYILEIEAGSRFNTIPSQASIEYIENEHVFKQSSHLIIHKIKKVYKLIKNIQEQMKLEKDDEFEPNHSTFSIGVIRQYEDYILIGGSCRIVPSVSQEKYEDWIAQFYKVSKDIEIEFHLQDYKKPFRISRKSILVKAAQAELEKLNQSIVCRTMASTNEVSYFSRMGIDCICIGVGEREGNIHTPNEKVALSQIETTIEFYQNMIMRMCN